MTNPRAPRAVLARAAAGILSLGLAAAVAGCAGTANADSKPSGAASAPKSATASPSPAAKTYGDAIGTGKTVKTADGSYETIALPASSPLYQSAAGPDVASAGYTKEDAAAAQKLAVDYMSTQFLDSTALETADEGFAAWLQQDGSRYIPGNLIAEARTNHTPGAIVLGDLAGSKTIPALIHDGKPREKTLTLSISSVAPYSDPQGNKGIKYEISYSVDYRITDQSAAAFAASKSTPPVTAQQWLNGPQAKPQLKDGKGENEYAASGSAELTAGKSSQGAWQIIGFAASNDFSMSDFAVAQ